MACQVACHLAERWILSEEFQILSYKEADSETPCIKESIN